MSNIAVAASIKWYSIKRFAEARKTFNKEFAAVKESMQLKIAALKREAANKRF